MLSGLGAVYAQLHEYKKAAGLLRGAIEREPDHSIDHYNLGIVCLLQKNRDCALEQYNYLRMRTDPLATTLFNGIHSDKVIDVSAYHQRIRP